MRWHPQNPSALFCMMALMVGISSCSSDDDGQPSEPKAEVSFVVSSGGTVSGDAPVVVKKGETLNMTISQKSSYTDADGQVYTCEPKATINLRALRDTLCVKDLKTLTSVRQKTPTTAASGTNPVVNTIAQTFDVGGQEIAFNLAYEVYRYATASGKSIEMPYVKLSEATYGEAKTGTRGLAAVTGIRLTPLQPEQSTRGVVLRDSTMYLVSVAFSLSAESCNTGSDSTTPLSFEVEYIGVVEETTELPDPATTFTYTLNVLGGTASHASPFTVNKGEELSLEWAQDCQYTYFSAQQLQGKTVQQPLKAAVALSVAHDTLRTDSLALEPRLLSATAVTTGTDVQQHAVSQRIGIGGQVLTAKWSYEAVLPFDLEGNHLELPYLKLDSIEVVSVNVEEKSAPSQQQDILKPSTANISNLQGEQRTYEVTVRLRQHLSGEQTPSTVSQNLEYIVSYIVVQENKLVDVAYEKDFQWVEPHYNIPPTSYYIVRRTRTYSSGDKVTDTFTSPHGRMVERGVQTSSQLGEYQYNDSVNFFYHEKYPDKNNDDYVKIVYLKTGVPDLSLLSWEIEADFDEWSRRSLDKYKDANTYTYKYNPENPVENWFVSKIERVRAVGLYYDFDQFRYRCSVQSYALYYYWYDRFLYLDGQMFDFSDYRPTYDYDFREERITLPDGSPARVFTHDGKCHYLGRDFYIATVDTIYQLPQSAK